MSNTVYLCKKCGHVYESSLGDPQQCIPPDHEISEVLQVWRCPHCRADGSQLAELMVSDVAADINTAKIGPDSPLRRLLKIVYENQWCTSFYCTTCGARPFRNALRIIPRDSLIRYLRELPEELCWGDVFKIIVTDIGVLPWGADLLDELDGTPAALEIRWHIQDANERYERHQAYMATQTPEAIAQRRIEREYAREVRTQPHRDRSKIRNFAMRNVGEYLATVPTNDLPRMLIEQTFEVPLRALGGFLYRRLLVHYRGNNPNQADTAAMISLADIHGGHWAKLIDKLRLER
jgi:rubredoxin